MKSKTRRVFFVCTEDWFFRSHFMPLHKAASKEGGFETTLVAQFGAAQADLAAAGLKVAPVSFARKSKSPLVALRLVFDLTRLLTREKPDIIHFLALKPVLLGGLATAFLRNTGVVYHVTGLGTIAEGTSRRAQFFRRVAFGLLAVYLRRKRSWLAVENPDDAIYLARYGQLPSDRTALFGGAGVDPVAFPALPPPHAKIPRIAFVGRMIWTKGVDVLIEAAKMLNARGVTFALDLYGSTDPSNPKSVSDRQLEAWARLPNVTWHGRVSDILPVWGGADICVVPTRTREGMPRAMLEAASCGRALVVTDVPGCRQFVRDGVEGRVVPTENATALAKALEDLLSDAAVRGKMGRNARARLLDGYTEADARKKVLEIYQALLREGNTP